MNNNKNRTGKNKKKQNPIQTNAIPRIVGQGGYFTDAVRAVGTSTKRMVPKGAFARIGRAAGGSLGGPLGAKLGNLLGQGISAITGFGGYTVNQNSLLARVDEGVQIPQFENFPHATIVRHREFVTDISATGAAFKNFTFPINPGLTSSFPWLSTLAPSYSSYQILGMIYEFKSLSSDITAGGALGSVIMATDYDAADPLYSSKILMENSEYACSSKPSMSFLHAIECDPAITFSPIKFNRQTDPPNDKDVRLYDWGNFQLATVGLPTSSGVLGELWVSYEIALYKPTLLSLPVMVSDHFVIPTSITTSRYFSLDTTNSYSPSLGSSLLGTVKASTYSFPPTVTSGTYIFYYHVTGGSTLITSRFVPVFFNCAFATYFGAGVSTGQQTDSGNTTFYNMLNCAVTVTGPNATVLMSAGTLPTAIISSDLFITKLPSNY